MNSTKSAYLWTSILAAPFWAIYSLLLFIIYKDLQATPLQITVFIILRPLVSIFSLYWSAYVNKRSDRLLPNIIWASLLGPSLFLFFPWIDNVWFFILASAIYMTLARGVFPAWMELLKLNLSASDRQKAVSLATTISFVGGGLLSLVLGWLLDDFYQIWRWIFPLAALITMTAVFFQLRIPAHTFTPLPETPPNLFKQLSQPWKNVWSLLKQYRDFRHFHIGYMLGGFGLVIIQPALPIFFIDMLNLSYKELTTALTLCKGLAFAISSPLWTKWLSRNTIFSFSSLVALLAALFPLLLIFAQINILSLFAAYLTYGIMQSGSELSWHLSGPLFCKEQDSSSFSSVTLAIVGLRGCLAPLLGGLLLGILHPLHILILGSSLSLIACLFLRSHHLRDSAPHPAKGLAPFGNP